MTKQDFLHSLQLNGIDVDMITFDNAWKDGYGVRKNKYRWEVYVRERGQDYDVMGFPSESDALQYLYEKLSHIYNIKK